MPNPYNPNPYNEDQDRARQQPLYDQPGGLRQDASQEYHKGDGVFQIPWWVIVITFCFAAWPIGVAMMIINHLLRMGKISAPQSWSQNNRPPHLCGPAESGKDAPGCPARGAESGRSRAQS